MTHHAKENWLLAAYVAFAAAACVGLALALSGCGPSGLPPKGPPMPPAVTRPVMRTGTAEGAGLKSPKREWDVAWQYPTNIDARGYCWSLQASADLTNWFDVTNATWAPAAGFPMCMTGEVTNQAGGDRWFWRMRGQPWQ